MTYYARRNSRHRGRTRYHMAGCRFLDRLLENDTPAPPITKKEAERLGFKPCQYCI